MLSLLIKSVKLILNVQIFLNLRTFLYVKEKHEEIQNSKYDENMKTRCFSWKQFQKLKNLKLYIMELLIDLFYFILLN